MTLTLADANRVIAGAIAKANELNAKMNIAVCDAGGRLLAFQRMDGAMWAGSYGSQGKAVASRLLAGQAETLPRAPIIRPCAASSWLKATTCSSVRARCRFSATVFSSGHAGSVAGQRRRTKTAPAREQRNCSVSLAGVISGSRRPHRSTTPTVGCLARRAPRRRGRLQFVSDCQRNQNLRRGPPAYGASLGAGERPAADAARASRCPRSCHLRPRR